MSLHKESNFEDEFCEHLSASGLVLAILFSGIVVSHCRGADEVRMELKTMEDVLTAYVARRNPYTLERSLADKDQRLVWVIAPDKQSILITTRNAAKAKSYELPAPFRSAKQSVPVGRKAK